MSRGGVVSVWLFCCTAWFQVVHSKSSALNFRPIIGIITQPTIGQRLAQYGTSAINSDYVDWVHAAGVRVVPIPYDASPDELTHLFNSVNGIVYPGGPDLLNGTLYYNASAFLFNLAIHANDRGDFFPIWGTCLGFQFLSIVVTGTFSSLSRVDAENLSLPLDLSPYAASSRMFSATVERDAFLSFLANNAVTENYHHWALTSDTFASNPKLLSFYNVISRNYDRKGVSFVSAFEAKDYPFYAVQFHPERPIFEWDPTEALDHSARTIQIGQYLANFFVSESRKNSHSFSDPEEEENSLIYNFTPIFTGKLLDDDEQFYVFNFTAGREMRSVSVA